MALKNSYWNHCGTFQTAIRELEKLIPDSGSVEKPWRNVKLEQFRKASNYYYDLYNNGLMNRSRGFYRMFGVSVESFRRAGGGTYFPEWACRQVEERLDDIIIAACAEQGIAVEADNPRDNAQDRQ